MEFTLHFQIDFYGLILCQDFNLFSSYDLYNWPDYNSNNRKKITAFYY